MEIITTAPRRSGRWVRILINLFLALTLLVGIALLVPTALGLQRQVITENSMSGSISLGSVVFSEMVPVADLRVGDVITYLPPPESGIDQLVTSRIVSITGDVIRTKGDAVSEADPWLLTLSSPSQARVKYDVPYVGYVFIAFQGRGFLMLLIGLPTAALVLAGLLQLLGALRRRSQHSAAAQTPSQTLARDRG